MALLLIAVAVGCGGGTGGSDGEQDAPGGGDAAVALPAQLAESVIDTTAIELTEAQRAEIEAACADEAEVPGTNEDCKAVLTRIPAGPRCVRTCLVVGRAAADPSAGVLAVVDVTAAADPCVSGTRLCAGVEVDRGVVDLVQVAGETASPTPSASPTPTPSASSTPTPTPTPSGSPPSPTGAPTSATPSPAADASASLA